MHKQEHFRAFLFGTVADILSLVPLQSSISIFYQKIALLSLDLKKPFLTVGLNWLHALWNRTSFCPLSYSQNHFCLPCWWCQQQAQVLISLQCCTLLYVQDMGTISLFVVPSMDLHRLSTRHCRLAVELKKASTAAQKVCSGNRMYCCRNVCIQEWLTNLLLLAVALLPQRFKSHEMSSTSHVMLAWNLSKQT